MAFNSNVSSEGTGFKMYTGVGSFYIKGINFNKTEIENFFGRELTNDPVYVDDVDVNGKMVKRATVALFLELEPNKYKDNQGNFINYKTTLYLSLRRMPVVGSNTGKIQVIDNYGRTAWGTPEVIESGKKIMYTSKIDGSLIPANIATPYKKVHDGEEALINFLIAYLNIPMTAKNVNGVWVSKEGKELEECQAYLDNVDKYFTNDFSEVKDAIALQPMNKVKLLVGIKTNEDGRQKQVIYGKMFMKNGLTKYDKLQSSVDDFMANTSQNVIYEVSEFHEYNVEPTNYATTITESNASEMPFPEADSMPFDF